MTIEQAPATPAAGPTATGVLTLEVRTLEGPNLYFDRAAMKVVLDVAPLIQAPQREVRRLARRLGTSVDAPGRRGSGERQAVAARLVRRLVRRMAAADGFRGLTTVARSLSDPHQIVVAFPWKNRHRAVALADGIAEVLQAYLDGDSEDGEEAIEVVAQRLADAERGDPPSAIEPTIPVASITGTNGKTTTTRLLAHIAMTAGLHTGWSSTSGVYVDGDEIEDGDYSGPAGARAVLTAPGVQIGVLETARGGMLLRGMGVAHNDVSVVTNVTADHLGMQGIDTVDQLAEVKGIVTRVTRPRGWCVLNGEDPRVWAMRARATGQLFVFALDPATPAVREAQRAGGRAATIIDGSIAILEGGATRDVLIGLDEVPVTLAGLSRHNIANALAATAAAIGLGLPREAIVEGLRTFVPDGAHNPGRMNTYTVPLDQGRGAATVILDMAHNEDGLSALIDVAVGLRAEGARFHLGLGTGGDRTDEILHGLGAMAGTQADVVHIVHKDKYLRDRSREDLEAQLLVGLASVGVPEVDSHPTELDGLVGLLAGAENGDVVAVMTHADWGQLHARLLADGATADDAKMLRRKVRAVRGEHEQERVLRAWRDDPTVTIADRRRLVDELLAQTPDDPRLRYESAIAAAVDGDDAVAEAGLLAALDEGLLEPHAHRARLAIAGIRRRTGRPAESLAMLDTLPDYLGSAPVVIAVRAMARHDLGESADAVADLVDALVSRSAGDDLEPFREVLHAQAATLRTPQPGA